MSYETSGSPNVVLVCGPKSSGKSTFTTHLTNAMISTPSSSFGSGLVSFLDVDPGQPEYSIPGYLSLTSVCQPNFGPPFTHPGVVNTRRDGDCSHFFGSVTPFADPTHYLSCVDDLLKRARDRGRRQSPLIVNTPGWVQGTGLEIMLQLIEMVRPTTIIYTSTTGPAETVAALHENCRGAPILTIPSQVKDFATRTAANLRSMQTMSYFHSLGDSGTLRWSSTPLTSMPPKLIRYRGERAGIVGIICYGEQPIPSLLRNAIEGTVLSVVSISDYSAISSWNGGQHVEHSPEGIPYIRPPDGCKIDPQKSESIGSIILRGVDAVRGQLLVSTPVPLTNIKAALSKDNLIVLTSGKLDTPGWAYTEELHRRATAAKRLAQSIPDAGGGILDASVPEKCDSEADVLFNNPPWVQSLSGGEAKGAGNWVWRVRRDLGRDTR